MRFGILGDAKIAREKLVPALRRAGCDIVHLGRRDELASVSDDIWQGVKTGSYEDVLADPKVEAVYIHLCPIICMCPGLCAQWKQEKLFYVKSRWR